MAITIEERGEPLPPEPDKPKTRIDTQDGCLVLGFCLLEAGTALIYVPAALILAGLLFIVAAGLIEATRGTVKGRYTGNKA
jgi:hypothetical protein